MHNKFVIAILRCIDLLFTCEFNNVKYNSKDELFLIESKILNNESFTICSNLDRNDTVGFVFDEEYKLFHKGKRISYIDLFIGYKLSERKVDKALIEVYKPYESIENLKEYLYCGNSSGRRAWSLHEKPTNYLISTFIDMEVSFRLINKNLYVQFTETGYNITFHDPKLKPYAIQKIKEYDFLKNL